MRWPQTQEEELEERLRRRRSLLAGGAVFCGFSALAVGLVFVFPGELFRNPRVWVGPAGFALMGMAGLGFGLRTSRRARTDLPLRSALGPQDPRNTSSLAQRRGTWVVGVLIWCVGLALGSILLAGLRPWVPTLVRMALFLGCCWGAVWGGARWVHAKNGSNRWPT